MTTRTEVAKLDELELGVPRRVVVGDSPVCVVRCNDAVRAIADTCSHEDFSLADGEADPDTCEIECWRHGSLFSLITGEPLTFPATQSVAVYPVTIEGDVVYVELDS
jgi:3-phenylpropionate/trans-cinnamate dioxygenase ferredoxin component